MQTTHTPAPWFIEDRIELASIGHRAILDSNGCTICNPSPMGEANARLIAAAPELLAALQQLIEAATHHQADARAAVDQARAAITRAIGGAA